jgi:hypothetical protein
LFLAPQGDTPVRITHFRVGDSQCQFGGRRHSAIATHGIPRGGRRPFVGTLFAEFPFCAHAAGLLAWHGCSERQEALQRPTGLSGEVRIV